MADFVAPGKVKSNTVGSFVAPGKVKSSPSKTSEPPAKNDPPKNLIIPDGYFTPEMIDSLAKVQKITDAKKIQAAKDKLLSENRLRGTAQEADYWNRLSTARKAQETDPNAIFVSPVSVPYDTGDTRASTAKNVAKGLLDILDLPSRAIAAGITEQKMSEPGAYAAKPVVDALLSEGLTSYGLEKAPLSPAERWVTETGGRFLSDPLNVLNPVKGAVIKGGKAVLAPIKTAKNIAKLAAGEKIDALKATGKTLLEIFNPPSLTKEIGKKGLKSQLGISAKDAENFARIIDKTNELVPSITGRHAVVDEIVDKRLYSSSGYNKMLENILDELDKAKKAKKITVSTKTPEDLNKIVDIAMEFDKLINKVKSGKVSSIAPEDVDASVRQLERLKSDYTSNEKLGLLGTTLAKEGTLPLIQQGIPRGSSAIGTIETAEEIKRKLGQGMFKDSPLFAHPVKARAKELAELQIADAIATAAPDVLAQNIDIRKMKALENILKKTAESYDKGNVLDRLASGEIVGSAVGSLSPITSRIPSTLLNIDYINRITGGSLPRNVATGLLNDERTKQDARRRALEKVKSDTLGGK